MNYESLDVAKPQQLKHDDIVMILMGATGTGKSHIIDTLTGQNGRLSGNSLECVTKYVTGHRILNHPLYGSSLVCVDTPGFDDTHLSDMEILEMISEWLVYMYRRNIPLAGIFYLHRITDNRMGGTPLRNLRIFNEICGDAAKSAVLITTMWDKLQSQTEGERREESLKKNYWNGMIQHGAFVDRFENTFKSAWDVVGTMVVRSRENDANIPILIQEELITHRKRLEETRAGRAMYRCLQDHLSKRQEAAQLLIDASKYQSDENLDSQLSDLQRDIEKILREVDRLHIPFSRRFFQFILDKSQRPLRMPLASATLGPGGIHSVFSNVNYINPRRVLRGYTVPPHEGENSHILTRDSWFYVPGVYEPSPFENSTQTELAQDSTREEPDRQSLVEHVPLQTETCSENSESQPPTDFVAAPGLPENKADKLPELDSEREHSLSDAEEYRVETEARRAGRTRRRVVSKKRNTRSLSRRRARSMSPTRVSIGQLGEIILPLKMENIQGGLHLHITLPPVPHVHGYPAGAAPTAAAPQVSNFTVVNSNNTCSCAHQVAETGGSEGNRPTGL